MGAKGRIAGPRKTQRAMSSGASLMVFLLAASVLTISSTFALAVIAMVARNVLGCATPYCVFGLVQIPKLFFWLPNKKLDCLLLSEPVGRNACLDLQPCVAESFAISCKSKPRSKDSLGYTTFIHQK